MLSTSLNTAWYRLPIQTWVTLFLTLSLITIPLSSTAKSIFIAISLGLILLSPHYWHDLISMLKRTWCQAAITLFLVAVVACAWSPASISEKLMEIEKYSKLLYLPVFAAAFRDPNARRYGLHGFLLGMLITVFASVLIYTGIVSFGGIEANGVFRNHIMTSYMMAFAAYLASLFFLRASGLSRIPYAVLVLLFSYQILFINNGRTGYVIYLLLMVLLMFQSFSWRQAFLGILVGCSLVTCIYFYSPIMQEAIYQAVNDYKLYEKSEKDTSIGYRLQFHDYAYDLFKRHPWKGNGAASFRHLYHEENPIPSRGTHLLEPHSQYWLVASEFGVLGCAALAFFFISLLVTSWQLSTLRPVALAILIPFFIGNLSDSLLFYSGTGYFFIVLMALCLGEQNKEDMLNAD